MRINPPFGFHPDLFSDDDTRVFVGVESLSEEDCTLLTPADFSKEEYKALQHYPNLSNIVADNVTLLADKVYKTAVKAVEELSCRLKCSELAERAFSEWLKEVDDKCQDDWPPFALNSREFAPDMTRDEATRAISLAEDIARNSIFWDFKWSQTSRLGNRNLYDFHIPACDLKRSREEKVCEVEVDLQNLSKEEAEFVKDQIFEIPNVEEVNYDDAGVIIIPVAVDGYYVGIVDMDWIRMSALSKMAPKTPISSILSAATGFSVRRG